MIIMNPIAMTRKPMTNLGSSGFVWISKTAIITGKSNEVSAKDRRSPVLSAAKIPATYKISPRAIKKNAVRIIQVSIRTLVKICRLGINNRTGRSKAAPTCGSRNYTAVRRPDLLPL
jgi:hypothetical protein